MTSDHPLDVEQDDFDSFYVRVYKPLVARAVVLGCPRDDAPELVQEVLIKIWRRWDSILWQTRSRYARTAVGNAVIDRYRQDLRGVPQRFGFGIEIGPGSWNGDSDVELTAVDKLEAGRALKYIKNNLSPRCRHVILMIADGYKSVEIAEELGLEPSGVRSHLHRARTLLKSYLEGRSS